MGCSVSRHMMIEVGRVEEIESALILDRNSSKRAVAKGGHRDDNNNNLNNKKSNHSFNEDINNGLVHRTPLGNQPLIIGRVSNSAAAESSTQSNTGSQSAVITSLPPKQDQEEVQQAEDETPEDQDQDHEREGEESEEVMLSLSEGTATTSSQSTLDAPLTPTIPPPTTWTKTACCGMQCQNPNSRFCCEHNNNEDDDGYTAVSQYCQTCRERYQYFQEANQAFEDILCELEQRQQQQCTTSSVASDLFRKRPQEEEAGGAGAGPGLGMGTYDDDETRGEDMINHHHHEDKSPVCLDDPYPTIFPVYNNDGDDEDIINRQLSGSQQQHQQQQQQPNPETQTGRYEVMCNSPSKDMRRSSIFRFSSSVASSSSSSFYRTTAATRYLYLLRNNPMCLSSLSLGDEEESATSSMHSF